MIAYNIRLTFSFSHAKEEQNDYPKKANACLFSENTLEELRKLFKIITMT